MARTVVPGSTARSGETTSVRSPSGNDGAPGAKTSVRVRISSAPVRRSRIADLACRLSMTTIAHHADYLCEAVARLGSESAFEVLARAKALEAQGRRVVHMEIGEPDFDTPEHIKEAGDPGAPRQLHALHALGRHPRAARHDRRLRQPLPRHRRPLRARERRHRRRAPNRSSGTCSRRCSTRATSSIYADPAYPAYASAAGYLEAKAIPVPLLESRNWRIDLDELAAKVRPRPKPSSSTRPTTPPAAC